MGVERVRAALTNLFIGDALAMPVHWYYNPGDIIRAFPPHGIRRMEAAPEHHPSSIMRLHSTSRGGRGAQASAGAPEVVGDVILKGKRSLWGRPSGHYHHGLPAGENTLNAWWARRLLNFLVERGDYDVRAWAEDYVAFMTADPPAHPDTYAESCHRGFFANLVAGRDPLDCGAVTHDTPSMGALVTVAPLALALLPHHALEDVRHTCREHVRLTHPDDGLLAVVDAYVTLMARLARLPDEGEGVGGGVPNGSADDPAAASSGVSASGSPGSSADRPPGAAASAPADVSAETSAEIVDAFVEAASIVPGTRLAPLLAQKGGDAAVVGRKYSLACYITDSWPSVCYLAAKYHADPERALVVNANLGGENAHRGAVLGTLVGLASGRTPEALRAQLRHGEDIGREIGDWIDRFVS